MLEISGLGHLACTLTSCRARKRKKYRDTKTTVRRMTEENALKNPIVAFPY